MPSREEEDKQIKQRERNARVQVVPDLSKAVSDRSFDTLAEPEMNQGPSLSAAPGPPLAGPASRNQLSRQEQELIDKERERQARNVVVVPDLASIVGDVSSTAPVAPVLNKNTLSRQEQDAIAKHTERQSRNITVVPNLAGKVAAPASVDSGPSHELRTSRHEEDIEAKRRERQSRNVRVVPEQPSKPTETPAPAAGRSELQKSRHEEDVDAKRRERQSRKVRVVPEQGGKPAEPPAPTGQSELQKSRHEEDIDAKRRERQSRNVRVVPTTSVSASASTSLTADSVGSELERSRHEEDIDAKRRERQSRNVRVVPTPSVSTSTSASTTVDSVGSELERSRHEEDIDAKRRERQSRNVRVEPNPGPATSNAGSTLGSSRHEDDIGAKRRERQSRNASRVAATEQSVVLTDRDSRTKQHLRDSRDVSVVAPPIDEKADVREHSMRPMPVEAGGVITNHSDIALNNSDVLEESMDAGPPAQLPPPQQTSGSSSSTEKERLSRLPPSGDGQQPIYVGALSVNTESNTAVLRPTTALPLQPQKASTPELMAHLEQEEEPALEAEHEIIIEDVEKGPPEAFAQAEEDEVKDDEEQGLSRRCWMIIGVIFIAVIGGAVGGVLASGGSSSDDSASTIPPATDPPLSERFIAGQSILADVSAAESFQDTASAQYKALTWLADSDTITPMEDSEQLRSRYSMAVFYYSLDGPNWLDPEDAWLAQTDECTWDGVTCNSDNQVQSIVQDTFANLAGTIPAEMQSLTTLETLDLKLNNVAGLTAPLTSLKILDLSENGMSGEFPSSIYEMTNLEQLYLQGNQLTGSVSTDMAALVNLVRLNFNTNPDLGGNFAEAFGGLIALDRLETTETAFTGVVELGAVSNLSYLDAGGNRLSGSLPSSLYGLTNLVGLFLPLNNISGGIGTDIGQLSNIQRLGLTKNTLGGPIPTEIGLLTRMIELQLSNTELSGTIPSEIGNCERLGAQLALADNFLSGAVPTELNQLTLLRQLFLAGNLDLTGAVPQEMCSFTRLTSISYSDPVECDCAQCLFCDVAGPGCSE